MGENLLKQFVLNKCGGQETSPGTNDTNSYRYPSRSKTKDGQGSKGCQNLKNSKDFYIDIHVSRNKVLSVEDKTVVDGHKAKPDVAQHQGAAADSWGPEQVTY